MIRTIPFFELAQIPLFPFGRCVRSTMLRWSCAPRCPTPTIRPSGWGCGRSLPRATGPADQAGNRRLRCFAKIAAARVVHLAQISGPDGGLPNRMLLAVWGLLQNQQRGGGGGASRSALARLRSARCSARSVR